MWKVSMSGLDTEQFVPLSQIANLLICEEWCNNFGNVTTTTMTRLFKCNFNFKTSIGHHLSPFCLQSLIRPERDKGRIYDSLVIVQKYTVSASSCFYAYIQSSLSWMFLIRKLMWSLYFKVGTREYHIY